MGPTVSGGKSAEVEGSGNQRELTGGDWESGSEQERGELWGVRGTLQGRQKRALAPSPSAFGVREPGEHPEETRGSKRQGRRGEPSEGTGESMGDMPLTLFGNQDSQSPAKS